MKKTFIYTNVLLAFMLCISIAIADTEVDIEVNSDENINAEIGLDAEKGINADIYINGENTEINVNNERLLKKSDFSEFESGGSVRNGVIEIFRRMAYGFYTNKLFNPLYDNTAQELYFYLDTVFLNRYDWNLFLKSQELEKKLLDIRIDELEKRIEKLEKGNNDIPLSPPSGGGSVIIE